MAFLTLAGHNIWDRQLHFHYVPVDMAQNVHNIKVVLSAVRRERGFGVIFVHIFVDFEDSFTG